MSIGPSLSEGWCQRAVGLAGPGEMTTAVWHEEDNEEEAEEAEEAEEMEEMEEEEGEEHEADDDEDEDEDEEGAGHEEGEAAAVHTAPPAWNTSDHQFALIALDRLRLLGLGGAKMAEEMAPDLRALLQRHAIEVGEGLDRLNARHAEVPPMPHPPPHPISTCKIGARRPASDARCPLWQVLSLLTGVRRSRRSAAQVIAAAPTRLPRLACTLAAPPPLPPARCLAASST